MEAFHSLTGIAAALPQAHVDTDQIMPKQFLRGIDRQGLSQGFLFDMRFEAPGKPRPDFVLNRAPWQQAALLITGPNFGCGSSREHAPWALAQYGFRAVIAPSFADIFFNNSYKTGFLPIVLSELQVARLFDEVRGFVGYKLTIDLEKQVVIAPDGRAMEFDITPHRKYCLLNGLDEIGLTLRKEEKIRAFEAERLARHPWLDVVPIVR